MSVIFTRSRDGERAPCYPVGKDLDQERNCNGVYMGVYTVVHFPKCTPIG